MDGFSCHVIGMKAYSILSPSAGDHLFRPFSRLLSLRGLCRGGPAGGDQLCVPPLQADAAHGQHGHQHALPHQQHDQPGNVRGFPDQHAGLDDPLAGAQQGQRAPPGVHTGQCGNGHHDGHEHYPLLPAAQERLFKEQHTGRQEGEGDVVLSWLLVYTQRRTPACVDGRMCLSLCEKPNDLFKLHHTSFLLNETSSCQLQV